MPADRMPSAKDLALLAEVRRALRLLNSAIEQGSRASRLTVQQQAFLLALGSRGGSEVSFGELRDELRMDQATASELLARLVAAGQVRRSAAHDRRAANVSLTSKGRAVLVRSIDQIRDRIRESDRRGELDVLRRSIDTYLAFYAGRKRGRAG